MLSLDDVKYHTPVWDSTQGVWVVEGNNGEKLIAPELNYTFKQGISAPVRLVEKLTLQFDRKGNVKASPRILRKLGNEEIRPVISYYYNMSRGKIGSRSDAKVHELNGQKDCFEVMYEHEAQSHQPINRGTRYGKGINLTRSVSSIDELVQRIQGESNN